MSGSTSQQTGNNAQKEDYLDKGLDAAEKKFGGPALQDTQKNRAVNEKIVSHYPFLLVATAMSRPTRPIVAMIANPNQGNLYSLIMC